MPPSELYYQRHVFCCINQRPAGHELGCCQSRGALKLQEYFKRQAKAAGLEKTRINKSYCLDRCELGPVLVIYPEGIWYTYKTEADVDEIIERHLVGGEIVERLQLTPDMG